MSVYYMDIAFFVYRKLLRCKCHRGYSPYQQKGINYYRTKCKSNCTNPDKNLTETDIHDLVIEAISKIYFTDFEIKEIETRAGIELGVMAQKRNNELEDLQAQRKKLCSDLDYLTENKLTLLRTQTMTMADIKNENERLSIRLAEIDARIKNCAESVQEMLNYVIAFSELVKTVPAYYKFALDTEKQEIVNQVFTELVFDDRMLVKYTAKEGFEALLSRVWVSGARDRSRTCMPCGATTSR